MRKLSTSAVLVFLSATYLVTLAFANSAPAVAQSRALSMPLTKQLESASVNLLQIARGLPNGDAEEAVQITDHASLFLEAQDRVDGLEVLISEMKHDDDEEVVRSMFIGVAQREIALANNLIEQINTELADIKSPAAVSEAIAIRDSIAKLRDLLLPYMPASAASGT